MKTKILFSTLLAAMLLSINIQAASVTSETNAPVQMTKKHNYEFGGYESEIKKYHDELEKTPQDIIKGFEATQNALIALDQNDTEGAQSQLKTATDFFNIAFTYNPDFKNMPVAMDVDIQHTNDTADNIQAIVENATRMLKESDIQGAIALLNGLKDQVDITIEYLPMELYPTSTKTAYDKLQTGDQAGAEAALIAGFDSIIVETITIPIGILESQAAIIAASELEKTQTAEAAKLLDDAKTALQKARLLGYTSKYSETYQSLVNQIDAIQKALKGKNEAEKLYEKIRIDYNKLLDTVIGKIPLLVG